MNQSEWFLQKYREWEKLSGRKQTEAAFAKFLGVRPPTLNRWMTMTAAPSGENLRMIARTLGVDIYEIVGQPVPDDLFLDDQIEPLAALILSLPEHKRRAFREKITEYAVKLAKTISEDP